MNRRTMPLTTSERRFIWRGYLPKRPRGVWAAFMRFSNKAAVIDYLSEESIVALSDFYFGKPYSWHVTLIGRKRGLQSRAVRLQSWHRPG